MRKSSKRRPGCQVGSAQRQFHQAAGLPLAQHLPAEQVPGICRRIGHFFRDRIFSPAVTLWTFLTQILDPDHSCRQAVARVLAWLVGCGRKACSAENGAYCRARQRLPERVLARFVRLEASRPQASLRRCASHSRRKHRSD